MTENKRFWIYILVAFGGGWLLMALGMLLGGYWYQGLLAAAMFMPLLGVLLAHGGLGQAQTGIPWMPELRGRGRWYLLAWFGPAVLSIVCAALFYALFPARFDGSMPALLEQIEAAEAAGQDIPLTAQALAAILLLQAVTYAPFLNAILAVGEEAGWRGYMAPYLMRRFGRKAGLILTGCLWAVWHWPLILCAGYEYGVGYPGAPYTGMLLLCVACAALGVLLSFLFERAGSIWAPALAHGAVNAAAGLGTLFLRADITSLFLGPTPFGLAAGIPLFILAAYILLRAKAGPGEPEKPLEPARDQCYTEPVSYSYPGKDNPT